MRHNSSSRLGARCGPARQAPIRAHRTGRRRPRLAALRAAAHVLQHAPLVFERRVFSGCGPRAFDFLALELPQVEQAKLLLLGALQSRPVPPRPAARRVDGTRRAFTEQIAGAREARPASRAALPARTEAADRAARGYRPGAAPGPAAAQTAPDGCPRRRAICLRPGSRARSAARRLRFRDPAWFEQPARRLRSSRTSKMPATRARSSPERTMSAEARPPSSSPRASTTMDLPLPVSPVSRFRPRVKADAQAVDHGIVLDHQFQQHSEPIIACPIGVVTIARGDARKTFVHGNVRTSIRLLTCPRARLYVRFEFRRSIDVSNDSRSLPSPNSTSGTWSDRAGPLR